MTALISNIYLMKSLLIHVKTVLQEKGFEKHMKDLVTDFQAHADKMGQIASFAAASSTDAKRKLYFPIFL